MKFFVESFEYSSSLIVREISTLNVLNQYLDKHLLIRNFDNLCLCRFLSQLIGCQIPVMTINEFILFLAVWRPPTLDNSELAINGQMG
jgi:hypothetical protein